jgi:hypothetical protein
MTTIKNIAVAVASLVIFTNISNAQAVKASYSVNYEEPMKVKYLGEDGDYLNFEVTFESERPTFARFIIEDKNEGELYSSFIESSSKAKTIKMEKNNFKALNFKLFVGKKTYSKLFSINMTLVETITVAERDITKL